MAGNRISRTVPAWLGATSVLLDVSGNNLTGLLPDNMNNGLSVCLLSGGFNYFSCPLPRALPPACAATVCACPAGKFFRGGDCSTCPEGTFSGFAASSCQQCAAGSVAAAGSASCSTCAAGSYAIPGAASCAACPPGSVAPAAGATSCSACSASTYAVRDASCTACPAGSTSPPASSSLLNCSCAYGEFPVVAADEQSLRCNRCPEGALCDSQLASVPLALAGFWHSPEYPVAFYACQDGVCMAEVAAPANGSSSNCRLGHTGVCCALCARGFSLQGVFCQPCRQDHTFTSWTRPKLAGFLAGAMLLFLLLTAPVLLSELLEDWFKERVAAAASFFQAVLADRRLRRLPFIGEDKETAGVAEAAIDGFAAADEPGGAPMMEDAVSPAEEKDVLRPSIDRYARTSAKTDAQPRSTSSGLCGIAASAAMLLVAAQRQLARLATVKNYVATPLRVTLESIQIISSFRTTFLHLPWPRVHSVIFDRLRRDPADAQLSALPNAPQMARLHNIRSRRILIIPSVVARKAY